MNAPRDWYTPDVGEAATQAITVEYTVTVALDGTTPAPPIEIDQSAEDATPFDKDAQVYRVEVERLGLIDPDLGIGGSIGPRCIPFLWIDTDVVGDAGASLDLVGIVVEGDPKVQKELEDLAGKAGTYFDENFIVAQGSAIGVSGFAVVDVPIIVRVSIFVPANCAEFALDVIARKTGAASPPYTPADPTDWVDPDPTTVAEAIDRIAAVVAAAHGPIP